ncbi:phosphoribosylformylglycinamidine synthase subunit PurS [Parvularcula lutaonensis]|uniref:Phosphoribosylformylglycinamidine synthase subunit PurS n=1 Tax=Parvularcula lutaonensis TaxID=491923 RepID=A0ABV7MCK3_9PROT|nr:phosphoribosylformylglycinamidine synthase subunit PurS [Parvularcula lutaonensis]GGY38875.1 phosphoribosylformylglycinamidine synthase subunit PurS [Parvularcula lutaonensis]
MKVRVLITLKNGVLDPQGKAIEGALHGLGFEGAENVRQGKLIELDIKDASSAAEAEEKAKAMCDKLLANPVMESYLIEVMEAA